MAKKRKQIASTKWFQKELIEDVKKYMGYPPFDTPDNKFIGDGYYYSSLVHLYGRQTVMDVLVKLRGR